MSGLRPQTPKLSSRPRAHAPPSTSSKLNPSAASTSSQAYPKSPPLTTSQNANSPYPFLSHSPGHYLAPKESGFKLKIKASTTPEAKTRLMKTPLGPRPRAGTTEMTRGDSMDSWVGGNVTADYGMVGLEDEVEVDGEIGPTETVMVSVR